MTENKNFPLKHLSTASNCALSREHFSQMHIHKVTIINLLYIDKTISKNKTASALQKPDYKMSIKRLCDADVFLKNSSIQEVTL
jgi:hypothetical protein